MRMCNVFEADSADDMCAHNHLHGPAVLKNLELWFKGMPYTYTVAICIAVNPCQWLDLYSKHLYEQYLEVPSDSLASLLSSPSTKDYLDMKRLHVDQSILLSGESGADKTETVKIMMNRLASVLGDGVHGTKVIDKVLKSNPLLESYGKPRPSTVDFVGTLNLFGYTTLLATRSGHQSMSVATASIPLGPLRDNSG